jgi:hypothetical protein
MHSADMLKAAKHDGLSDFAYALAGGSADQDCGSCYQVRPNQEAGSRKEKNLSA